MSLIFLLKWFFVVLFAANFARSFINKTKLKNCYQSLKTITGKDYLVGFLTLLATAAVGLTLIQFPVLSWGWWALLGENPGGITGLNADTAGVFSQAPILLAILFIAALPVVVRDEEELFRRNSEKRTPTVRALWAVGFGLYHMVIGVPLGLALALTIPGLVATHYYMQTFKNAKRTTQTPVNSGNVGVLEKTVNTQEVALAAATRAHLAYNAAALVAGAIILGVVLL